MTRRQLSALRWIAHVALLLAVLPTGVPGAQAGLPEAVQRVKPSVVAVGTYQKTRNPAFLYRATGFVVGDGTLVATNAHVVPETLKTESGEMLMVRVHVPGAANSEAREAAVIKLDKEHDLALLRIVGTPLPAVALGDSDAVRDGQSIAFTGFPLGNMMGFNPVTHRGIVAALTPIALPYPNSSKLDARAIATLRAPPVVMFQLDATIYSGHSGSPVFDENTGEVIGIINMGLDRGVKDPAVGQSANISFAVPVRHLRDLMNKGN